MDTVTIRQEQPWYHVIGHVSPRSLSTNRQLHNQTTQARAYITIFKNEPRSPSTIQPTTATMPYPSLTPFIIKRPWLHKLVAPIAEWYKNAAGYRQLGLRTDDLLIEENEEVLKALKRLPAQVQYDRVFRLRRALQCSVSHKLLPKDQWTKPEDDVPYLAPLIRQIRAEEKEKTDLDSLTPIKKH